MNQPGDTNAAIWQSDEIAAAWAAEAAARERNHAAQWRFMADLLPFGDRQAFTFLDLGAGTGNSSRAEMQPYEGRFRYVTFDLSTGDWPAAIPEAVDAVVTSLFVHHLPDDRKRDLFAEILTRLVPGGWYLNYDPVRATDPVVAATWERVADLGNPEAARKRLHPTPQERARYENHVRHMIPLDRQLEYLRSAGFDGIDVYWKRLEYVIYGGCRPR